MFFQPADASFKITWKLEKHLEMTEIFLNEKESYPNGYKLIVTNEDNKMIPFTTVKISENHIGL